MAEIKEKYLVSVVPLTKIPLSREQFFYYLSNTTIPSGSLVEVSLGKRKINGIVLDSKNDFTRSGNYRMKKIEKILEESFLTEKQIALAKFISEYYFTSLGIVLKMFVPDRVKARATRKKFSIPKPEIKNIVFTKAQNSFINKIYHKNCKLKVVKCQALLFGPSSSGKTEACIQVIAKLSQLDPDTQFLIIVPELTQISPIAERIFAHFDENEIAILHSKIPKGQFYSNWQAIKSGKIRVIIGTRQALFAPFKKLKLIVIDEDHDVSFKQWDASPRYESQKIAEKLTDFFRAHLLLSSATPRVENYYLTESEKYKLIKFSHLNIGNNATHIEVVDMKKERWVRNKSPLSRKLRGEIEYALKNKLQTILFVNRQGMSAFSVCKKCKEVLKCPKCRRALIYQKKGNYKCLHCSYKTSDFPTCPNCKEMIFENVGIGTEKILRELRKNFYSARIEIADNQTMKSQEVREKIWRDFSDGKIDILIGTQMITKGWDLKNVGFVGIIDADGLLSFPDLFTNENAFAHIVQAAGRTGRPGSRFPGEVVVQTFQPENFVIKSAIENDFRKFYEKELGERKELDYPPFGKLIKLIFQDQNEKKAKKETDRVFQILEWVSEDLDGTRIYPPQNCMLSNIRGKHRKQIIIKYKTKDVDLKIKKAIQSLGPGWIIDRDPISII
ncbi:MAG: Primosome assembly protein PriA [Candidatus Moranbacteria bacterium GW2011_GWE2_35_2-]|nr:MAG: Primosome assembly protein PriA [Candidatus Moranbacteria bacterium GW2011_GWE2_35_2-]KKQ06248.1 MAG: Primosome assembly protein PriA [Candidatus Moranbacteria bacterium GW2011_GWF1_36_4]KKQ22834.1 MAG: Primosome assembly protein PriA [Candidatus Moranbacteria bacterium GW2011_GWF2_37_11]KKQ28654.1 MAG: Primosome assembly protein PriA [Candidatus Moranbacteria bacterium GW2011_GWD1_37_17]KKQ30935.1 MAG: Primosome assembly protein PriA [Candidatus Moranbacteria bacterium GW2011_GWE1_37_2